MGHHNGGSRPTLCADAVQRELDHLRHQPPSPERSKAMKKARGRLRAVTEYRSVWPEIVEAMR